MENMNEVNMIEEQIVEVPEKKRIARKPRAKKVNVEVTDSDAEHSGTDNDSVLTNATPVKQQEDVEQGAPEKMKRTRKPKIDVEPVKLEFEVNGDVPETLPEVAKPEPKKRGRKPKVNTGEEGENSSQDTASTEKKERKPRAPKNPNVKKLKDAKAQIREFAKNMMDLLKSVKALKTYDVTVMDEMKEKFEAQMGAMIEMCNEEKEKFLA